MGPAAAAVELPAWVDRLMETGEKAGSMTISEALPFLPMTSKKAYVQAQRYLARIERERARRRSYLLPAEILYAKENELPCLREGRNIMLVKHLLVVRLLGYDPAGTP